MPAWLSSQPPRSIVDSNDWVAGTFVVAVVDVFVGYIRFVVLVEVPYVVGVFVPASSVEPA